ncbi:ROK family protein [Ligilactobacillus agilis]|uniref:ROK family protein n=1 Tax=Ligilactobacillus agilis TaxID=1601 RepID=UPI001958730E|nr:ROK family protein [Ligilactobacillus agilis]MBM6772167.1 ROK family protein [Ligilactobacillus agilis]
METDLLAVSACIITRNEAEKLRRCLACLSKLAADIVVIDTGSQDETAAVVAGVEVARYFYYEWPDDFSLARNYALKQAKYDQILVVDSDEWFANDKLNQVKAQIERFFAQADLSTAVGTFVRLNLTESGWQPSQYLVTRLFSRQYFHYQGKLHERPVPLAVERKRQEFRLDIELLHDGYLEPEVFEQKAKRNLMLLLKEQKLPATAAKNPYVLYQVAQTYRQTGRKQMALVYFRWWLLAETNLSQSYFQVGLAAYLELLLEFKQVEFAAQLLTAFGDLQLDADNSYLAGIIYSQIHDFDRAIVHYQRALALGNAKRAERSGQLGQLMLANTLELSGKPAEAVAHYFAAGINGLDDLKRLKAKQLVSDYYLTLDLGQSHLKLGLFDEAGSLVVSRIEAVQLKNYQQVEATVMTIIANYQFLISGVGIALFGRVNTQKGTVGLVTPLGYEQPLVERLEAKFKLPVVVINDAKAALLAEQTMGSLKAVSDGALVTLGTSIGGGVILANRIHEGRHQLAGEFSYLVQNKRFLSESASAVKLMTALRDLLGAAKETTDHQVFLAALENPLAKELIQTYSYNLATVLVNLQVSFDLERIAIGGGLGQEEKLIALLNQSFLEIMGSLPNNPLYRPELVAAKLGNQAGLYGAYQLLKERMNR